MNKSVKSRFGRSHFIISFLSNVVVDDIFIKTCHAFIVDHRHDQHCRYVYTRKCIL